MMKDADTKDMNTQDKNTQNMDTQDVDTQDMYAEKISLWLDDELSPTEIVELEAHLADCSTCCQTYEAMQRVHQLLHTAATVMMIPQPGFTQRFETRLARRQPSKPWQIWLAVGALLLGTLFLVGTYAVMGSMTLVSVSTSVLDVRLVDQGLVTFIHSVGTLRVFFNLGLLFLKATFITLAQPLFWGCVLVAVILMGLWVRVMQLLSRGVTVPAQLML